MTYAYGVEFFTHRYRNRLNQKHTFVNIRFWNYKREKIK